MKFKNIFFLTVGLFIISVTPVAHADNSANLNAEAATYKTLSEQVAAQNKQIHELKRRKESCTSSQTATDATSATRATASAPAATTAPATTTKANNSPSL